MYYLWSKNDKLSADFDLNILGPEYMRLTAGYGAEVPWMRCRVVKVPQGEVPQGEVPQGEVPQGEVPQG